MAGATALRAANSQLRLRRHARRREGGRQDRQHQSSAMEEGQRRGAIHLKSNVSFVMPKGSTIKFKIAARNVLHIQCGGVGYVESHYHLIGWRESRIGLFARQPQNLVVVSERTTVRMLPCPQPGITVIRPNAISRFARGDSARISYSFGSPGFGSPFQAAFSCTPPGSAPGCCRNTTP